jgi:hypothetical protein
MEHTSKGAQLLRTITDKALTQPGAKWTPSTGWTDEALKKRQEYEQWRHKPKQGISAEEADHMEAMRNTSSREQ